MLMFATFTALAEPNRLRIVDLLRSGPQPVGRIGEALGLRQPQTSKHLQVLKAAGLVGVRTAAQQRLYELRGEPLRELHTWLEQYRELWDARLSALDDVIRELKQKDQPRAAEPSMAKAKKKKGKRDARNAK